MELSCKRPARFGSNPAIHGSPNRGRVVAVPIISELENINIETKTKIR